MALQSTHTLALTGEDQRWEMQFLQPSALNFLAVLVRCRLAMAFAHARHVRQSLLTWSDSPALAHLDVAGLRQMRAEAGLRCPDDTWLSV